jgi:hypothetical protein
MSTKNPLVPQAVALQVVVRSHLPTQFTGDKEASVEDPLLVVAAAAVTDGVAAAVSDGVAAAAVTDGVVAVVFDFRKLGMGIYFKYIPAATDELMRQSIISIINTTIPPPPWGGAGGGNIGYPPS